jgi:hypothetical protein
MLTKQDCIEVGKAITSACTSEKDNFHWKVEFVYALNGMQIRALNNLWFDVFSAKQREYFGYDYENFSNAVIGSC